MPGIDAITLGPTDLSQDLGVYGTPAAGPVLDEHRYRIIEATKRYGKTAAMLVSSVEQARKWRDAGVLLLGYSSEVSVKDRGVWLNLRLRALAPASRLWRQGDKGRSIRFFAPYRLSSP
jgi:2-keto-3-deoxy-L-rhamnonate aldolase RhmA